MAKIDPVLGFVGLGHMGGSMAARFLQEGYEVYGEERTRDFPCWPCSPADSPVH